MNHYAVLGVAEDATYAEIRSSYLSCLLSLHPDKQQQQQEEEEEVPLSSSRFLRLQEAWDVLRDPQSRSSYDRHLASTRLVLMASVAEDVLLEEMARDCEDAEAGTSFVYPCRCGDSFAVSLQELDDLGFCGKSGSCRSIASKDHSEEQDNNTPNQSRPLREHHAKSLIVPCGSCSLQIRLLF